MLRKWVDVAVQCGIWKIWACGRNLFVSFLSCILPWTQVMWVCVWFLNVFSPCLRSVLIIGLRLRGVVKVSWGWESLVVIVLEVLSDFRGWNKVEMRSLMAYHIFSMLVLLCWLEVQLWLWKSCCFATYVKRSGFGEIALVAEKFFLDGAKDNYCMLDGLSEILVLILYKAMKLNRFCHS